MLCTPDVSFFSSFPSLSPSPSVCPCSMVRLHLAPCGARPSLVGQQHFAAGATWKERQPVACLGKNEQLKCFIFFGCCLRVVKLPKRKQCLEICNRGLMRQIDRIPGVLKCERAKSLVRISHQLAPYLQRLCEQLIHAAC